METIDSIPTSKIRRATRLISTGVKIGGNYLKYYGEKITSPETARDNLNSNNAEDIYDSLKSLKGSALKLAQMLSMEKNFLPQAYVEKFSLSQFSVPPLSAPLVVKTFRKYFGKSPLELFDTFNPNAINAASIGQVHKAVHEGKELAVKIQYPGVAESISSDLALVKPIAMKMFNIQAKDSDKYFKEVETKLTEETNYILEIANSTEIAEACEHIPNLRFPKYYPEFSSERVITMDWMSGQHWSEFCKSNPDQDTANKIGQALWDFYMFQVHQLRKVHADPHPGNFLIDENDNLIAIDFGCIKEIPEDFYIPYFELAEPENLNNPAIFHAKLVELEILTEKDTQAETIYFSNLFREILALLTQPFQAETFDFSDEAFFLKLAALGEKYANDKELRKMNMNRGSKHFIYINRTFFGLFSLLHDLKAVVDTKQFVS
ncbi:putative unusual protein kinase regulating ubiquinone biosynthesis (AarF/ABC1/UbiB family) [Dyadobacter sp. BE34]|uniref:Unusual protein kinase regulating ubiquinone biosynthesis (AarF/ABC1/UbiB family) n=1 Tax=Dyadobacter fermentans TaxID=94254 RepID=A0ABU1R804_9BACT|nr:MULTISPECIES: AarF/ABC1/UbiB kinase family protein [Dyadobacter]MDR6809534.1 putative unusual protein kinase regulating ubiquinone biosynthesis (AarF/ABC1/UbiB family) [Dyadobacter fermentans]MDR7047209.1 putative unusual protein kinase regulating ubiquinone biosynthesis (AarF/ABC1/UbiB family) [Dyadobacter sp. BE242]MDR7201445.1 putative unusual protein kinase regulating ubiquinone biosynthesis (AarF/ABC1/UbiB family) [Dyadobacter sp. BE34]MDR7219315.1 putative unusual protein kinase regula